MIGRLQNITNAQVGIILSIFAILGLIISVFAHTQSPETNWWQWADGAFQNFSTEVIGAILTFGLIEILVGGREKREAGEKQHQRDQLEAISELLRANTQEAHQTIVNHMNAAGLFKKAPLSRANLRRAKLGSANLTDADLKSANLEGADLRKSNLERADLSHANLEGADLSHANLEGANLEHANLEGANLLSANLKKANLLSANLKKANLLLTMLEEANLKNARLEGANLLSANLKKANLLSANLGGTNLGGTNLMGADLENAILDKVIVDGQDVDLGTYITTLPDGTPRVSNTNMRRFTDRNHPEFGATQAKINTIREEM